MSLSFPRKREPRQHNRRQVRAFPHGVVQARILQEEKGRKVTSTQRLILLMTALVVTWHGSACSYPKERFREFQKEVARKAAEPRTPEERCQRQGGIMNGEQCYTPSTVALDERTCRLRGGLYLEDRCLVSSQGNAAAPVTP